MRDEGRPGVSLGEAELVLKTYQALLVRLFEHGDEEVWVPLSQVHDDSELYDASGEEDTGKVVVTEWWAEKNGYA